jgi:hypothetical protein
MEEEQYQQNTEVGIKQLKKLHKVMGQTFTVLNRSGNIGMEIWGNKLHGDYKTLGEAIGELEEIHAERIKRMSEA